MASLLEEDLIPFAAGIRTLPGRPHISTGYRFALRGIRGNKLETIVCGGRRYTSKQALRRFIEATTRAANERGTTTQPPAAQQTETATDGLDKELDRAGL